MRLARRLVAALLVMLVASGCQVDTEVVVDVDDDGSGTVSVAIGLDDDALAEVPGIDDELRVDDLRATGWTVSGPERDDEGFTWFRATKAFATVNEASEVLTEVAGGEGPFRDLRVSPRRSFARTSFTFAGTVDLRGGLEAFADDELRELLDGEPLGEDVAEIEAAMGQPVDEVFRFRVVVRLPGDISSNAEGEVAGAAVWEPRLSDGAPLRLEATGRAWRVATLFWVALALIAALALLALLLMRLTRRHGRPSGIAETGRQGDSSSAGRSRIGSSGSRRSVTGDE